MSSSFKKLFTKCRYISPSLYLVIIKILPALFLLLHITGCASETVNSQGIVPTYQAALAVKGPQKRTGTEGLEAISPVPEPHITGLKEIKGTTGRTTINLTLEDTVLRVLANSPEITVVSFDPSIAKENIAVEVSEFDVTAFGQYEYDKNDFLPNDISQSGQTNSSLWEAGIKQKGITGAEWSLAYALTRSFDESITRTFSTSYEPTMTFKLKQPLLRDAWPDINLAGVNISKLNYRIALASFHRKAEDVATQVISLYWTLLQARQDVKIQQDLLDKTVETLRKVEDRKNIDATVGDIKQAEASVKSREAALFEAERKLSDVQDGLVRLLSDHQMNLIDDLEIVPVTAPDTKAADIDQSELLKLALKNNQAIYRAQLEAEVAEINVKVAKRQKMPRLDIVASAQLQGLSDSEREAHEMISNRDYTNYTIGVTLEYPLGNREKKTLFRLRKLKHSKALSNLHNVSDQVAIRVKESMRFAETAHREIQVQIDAVNAARIYLQALEDIETIRRKLTPEFLLTKIQAQDFLANAKRAEIKAVVDYNIALTKLAQATGTVLDIRSVRSAFPTITNRDKPKLIIPADGTETDKLMAMEATNSVQEQGIIEEIEKLTDKEKAPDLKQPLVKSVRMELPVLASLDKTKIIITDDVTETDKLVPMEATNSVQEQEITEETEKLILEEKALDLKQALAKEATTGSNEYYIQVGSWENPDFAQEYFLKLKKYYPEVYIEIQNNFNKVRIPGVMTKTQGANICKDIEERFKLQPFLVLKTQ